MGFSRIRLSATFSNEFLIDFSSEFKVRINEISRTKPVYRQCSKTEVPQKLTYGQTPQYMYFFSFDICLLSFRCVTYVVPETTALPARPSCLLLWWAGTRWCSHIANCDWKWPAFNSILSYEHEFYRTLILRLITTFWCFFGTMWPVLCLFCRKTYENQIRTEENVSR